MAALENAAGSNELAALLFLAAVNETMQAYGTLNSSPWTAESFGADDRRAKALKEYVGHAVAFSMLNGLAAAWIASSPRATYSIIFGTIAVNAYLVWLYARASQRGRAAGSKEWANSSQSRQSGSAWLRG